MTGSRYVHTFSPLWSLTPSFHPLVVFDSIRRGHHQRRRRQCDQLRLHHCRLWYNKSLRFINYPCTLIGGGGGLTVVVAGSAKGGEGGHAAAPCHEINFPDGKENASMHRRFHPLSRALLIFETLRLKMNMEV